MASIYQPLRSDRREFRLLKLEPAPNLDYELVCSLVLSSLDINPKYDALSYAWGDPAITKPISLNGLERSVTTSLELALRYFAACIRHYCHLGRCGLYQPKGLPGTQCPGTNDEKHL